MKITIKLSPLELKRLIANTYCPSVSIEDLTVEVVEMVADVFTQRDHAMFAEVRQLRSSNQVIAAIKAFRARTGFGLCLSKYACEDLDTYIAECRTYGGFKPNFKGYNA